MMNNKDLVVKEENLPFVVPEYQNFKEVIEEELQGYPITFTRVKFPTAGNTTFEIPTGEEEPEITKEIVGVVVDHYPVNALWLDKFNGDTKTPKCYSLDGKNGIGEPGGQCALCPYNQFGSAPDSRGKMCKNMWRLYIIRNNEYIPLLLTLPPTSVKNWIDFISKKLLSQKIRPINAIIRITLKKVTNLNGISYSQAQFNLVRKLNQEELQRASAIQQGIRVITRKILLEDEDYNIEDKTNNNNEDCPF